MIYRHRVMYVHKYNLFHVEVFSDAPSGRVHKGSKRCASSFVIKPMMSCEMLHDDSSSMELNNLSNRVILT